MLPPSPGISVAANSDRCNAHYITSDTRPGGQHVVYLGLEDTPMDENSLIIETRESSDRDAMGVIVTGTPPGCSEGVRFRCVFGLPAELVRDDGFYLEEYATGVWRHCLEEEMRDGPGL